MDRLSSRHFSVPYGPFARAPLFLAGAAFVVLVATILSPAPLPAQGLAGELLREKTAQSGASAAPSSNGSPGAALFLSDNATSAGEAISQAYIEARIRYLQELQKIQQTELAELEKVKGAEKKEAAAPKAKPTVAAPKRGLWDQVREGKNIFVSVWNLQIITISGEPVTIGKIILGLAVLIIGFLLSGRITREVRKRLIVHLHVDENAMAAFEKVFFYAFIIFVILFSLQLVNIPLSIFAFLGGAIALAFGFGAQNILNNFISGWIIMAERPIRIGDLIELEGDYGSVESIGARCTRIRLFTGIHILVPNSALLEKNVINWTLSDDKVRVFVSVGVAYGSPTRKVEELMNQAVTEHKKILNTPPPIILFEEFGDNSLLFEVHFWVSVRRLMDARQIKSDIRYRIDDLCREANIVIAFPQRDVHLDTLSPLRIQLLSDEERAKKAAEEESAKEELKQAQEQEEAERREKDTKTGSG